MAKKSEIDIVVKADTTQAQAGFNKLKNTTTGFSGKISSLKASFGAAQIAILGFAAAATGAALAVGKLAKAWIDEEKGIIRLNNSLAAHGINVKSARKEIEELATSLQYTANVADDETRAALDTLIGMYGMDLPTAIQTTKRAVDFAAASDKDLNTVVDLLGKAYKGNTGMLSKYGIVIDATKIKTEGYNVVLDELAKYEGRAAANAQTLEGRLGILQKASGDVQEAIGRGLVEGFLNAVSGGGDLSVKLQELTAKAEDFAEFLAVDLIPTIAVWGKQTYNLANLVISHLIKRVMAAGLTIQGFYYKIARDSRAKDSFAASTDLLASLSEDAKKYGDEAVRLYDSNTKKARDKRRKEYRARLDESKAHKNALLSGEGGDDGAAAKEVTADQKARERLAALELKYRQETVKLRKNQGLDEQYFQDRERDYYDYVMGIVKKEYPDALETIIGLEEKTLDLRDNAQKQQEQKQKEMSEAAKAAHEQEIKDIQDAANLKIRNAALENDAITARDIELQTLKETLDTLTKMGVEESVRLGYLESISDIEAQIAADRKKEIAARRERKMGSRPGGTGEVETGALDIGVSLRKQQRAAEIRAKYNQDANKDLDVAAEKVRQLTEAVIQLELIGKADDAGFKVLVEQLETARADVERIETERKTKETADKFAEAVLNEQQRVYDGMRDALADGLEDGAKSGFDSLVEHLEKSVKKRIINSLADAMMQGMFGGRPGGAAQDPGIAAAALSGMGGTGGAGAAGGGFMGGLLGGGAGGGGGILSGLLGGGGGAGGGGIFGKLLGKGGGAMAGIMPWLGVGMMAMSFLKKGKSPEMSGVDPIFGGQSRTVSGGGMDALYGSDVFERAAYSSRNIGNDILRAGAGIRQGVDVTVKAAREFDVVVSERMVNSSQLEGVRGTPVRTGHENP